MKVGLYTIYDRVAEESGKLWEAKNDGVALRGYQMFLEKEKAEDKTGVFEPLDYMLTYVGEWNKTENTIAPVQPRQVIAKISIEEVNE